MAWHYTEFYEAVYDRLSADATLGGLIQGAWSVAAPEKMPDQTPVTTYVVTAIETAGTEDEGLRTLVREYRLAITIINPAEATGATDPLDLQGQIAERIEGNWYDKGFGVQPDYGLARWAPTLTSWDCTPLQLIDIQTLDAGKNRLALGMAFEVRITKGAA